MKKLILYLIVFSVMSQNAIGQDGSMTPYRKSLIMRRLGAHQQQLPSDANLASQLFPNGAISSAERAVEIGRVYMREAFGEESFDEMGPLVAWFDQDTEEWVVEVSFPPNSTGRDHMLRLARKDGRVTHIYGIPPKLERP